MIIRNLKLNNFGRHTSVDFKSNANVVGVLGVNGTGKTTVLEGLQFALTGETEYAQETYVKDLDGNGSVELEFTKNGQTGKIFRQVGKTPKRELVWDGEKVKSAKKVDAIMESLFGASKSAVSNAVFIKQGHLKDTLFGTDAVRQELFIKLVNLAFCDQYAKVVEGKIQKLKSTVTDLTGALDQARTAAQVAVTTCDLAQVSLDGMPDYSRDIQQLEQSAVLSKGYDDCRTQWTSLQQQLMTARAALAEKVTASGHSSVEMLLDAIKQVDTAIGVLNEGLQWSLKTTEQIANYMRVQSLVDAATKEVAAAITALNEAPKIPNIEEELTKLQTSINGKQSWENLRKLLVQAQESMRKAVTGRDALKDPNHRPTIADRRLEKEAVQKDLQRNKNWLATMKKIQACMSKLGDDFRCQDCGLVVLKDQQVDQAEIDSLESKIEESDIQLKTIESAIFHMEVAQSNYDNAFARLTSQIELHRQSEIDLSRKMEQFQQFADVDAVSADAEKRRLIESKQNLKSLQANMQAACQRLGKHKEDLQKLESVKEFIGDARCDIDYQNGIRRDINGKQLEFNTLNTALFGVKQTQGQIEQLEKSINEAADRMDMFEDQLQELAQIGLSEHALKLREMYQSQDELILAEMKVQQSNRSNQEGVLKASLAHRQAAEQSVKTLEERMEKDAKKIACIQQLQTVKGLLSRTGVPGRYVQHRFDQLAVTTRSQLNQMGAGFSVAVDPERPLAFRFHRHDDGGDLPMEKLSGGQKVRLCLAFLMAVQLHLVPDVGLLVLDEPSMHLDDMGKEGLTSLLTDTGRRLGSSESQVWVVDHAEEIEPALGAVLRLK